MLSDYYIGEKNKKKNDCDKHMICRPLLEECPWGERVIQSIRCGKTRLASRDASLLVGAARRADAVRGRAVACVASAGAFRWAPRAST